MIKVDRSPIQFQIGEVYSFIIHRIDNNYCELLDESGYVCYLQNTNLYKFTKGQAIQCKVLDYKAEAKHPKIEIVATDNLVLRKVEINESAINDILKEQQVKWNTKGFGSMLLISDNSTFENECHRWIKSLIDTNTDLQSIRKDCFTFLEQSKLLAICKPTEREFFQQRMTSLIELIGYYIKAGKYEEEETALKFIDGLFEKLRKSGFVYHPSKNFNIMSCLFLNDRQLMEDKLGELFAILRQWGLDIWLKEPFRTTLVKVLELYINENIWKVDRIKDNKHLVKDLIQALSIQMLLIGKDKETVNVDIDKNLNIARLCALATYANVKSPKSILELTLTNLLNPNSTMPSFNIDDTGTEKIPYFIDAAASGMTDKLRTTNSYIHGKVKLTVSGNGIILNSCQEGQPKSVLPTNLGLWGNIQVNIDKKAVKTPVGIKNISVYEKLWRDIECELFKAKEEAQPKNKSKKKHRVGENVPIIITKQDSQKPTIFSCEIADEIGGVGYITKNEIAPYQVTITESDFMSDKGERLLFEAQIIDIDEEGRFKFSMLELIKDFVNDGYYLDDEKIICSVGADIQPGANGRYPAVTKEGVSVSLGGFESIEEESAFVKGDVVLASYLGPGLGSYQINCNIIERSKNNDYYLQDAFKTLMRDYAFEAEEEETAMEEEDLQTNDRILDDAYMKEIIRVIDRVAIIDNEYVKSYNYLGFARILCMMIGWGKQAEYYKNRMELIAMLHDFAVNDKVDETKLALLDNSNAEMFSSNSLLRERYEQLEIVSFLGKPEHEAELLKRYTDSQGIHYTLASLVLGYNILKSQNLDSQANDVHNKIKQTLKLKGFESHLLQYGSGTEDVNTEYKTSIIYPPEDMQPNIQKQMKNILRVIATFLNTEGGTLYVGVNDAGAGVGLQNDLNYPEFNGDKDKYQRHITDAVVAAFGKLASTCVKDISFDPDNKEKDVLIVKVSPFHPGVEYEGKWWVRIGSTKRDLSKKEFEAYNSNQRSFDKQSKQPIEVSVAKVKEPAKPEPVSTPKREIPQEGLIATSKIRKNNLEGYEAPFPIAYFKFLQDDKFCKIESYDYQPELLTLAVLDEERDAYVVMGYDDGTVTKVPVSELLEKPDYNPYTRCSGPKLIFATIAHDGDAVISVTKEAKGYKRIMVRLDSVSKIEEGRIVDKGLHLYNAGLASEVIEMDVIPQMELITFKNMIDQDARSLGSQGKTLPTAVAKKLNEFGIRYK